MPSPVHFMSQAELEVSPIPRQVVRRRLEEFWLHVNFPCNLSCTHCLFSCNPKYSGIPDLTLEQAQAYTEEAQAAGVTKFYITGGEPLMWKPLQAYLAWYFSRPHPQRLVILTNGTLIGERWAEPFAQYHPQGLEMRISLECYTVEENDRWRGEGSHARAMKGIAHLNRRGLRPYIAFANKSGGMVTVEATKKLEAEFRSYLGEHFGVEIAGVKTLGAWEKGQLDGKVKKGCLPDHLEEMADTVQCSFGLAASGLGLVPCPIVTDVKDAVLDGSMQDLIGQAVDLKFRYCRDCFKTGGT